MRKLLTVLSLSSLLVLAACGESENQTDAANNANNENETNLNEGNNNSETNNNENNTNNEESGDFETQVGETIENEAGVFTLHARQHNIDTIETGPIVLDLPQVNAASGEITDQMVAELVGSEEMNYVQVDVEVENTSDEDVTFFVSQATISTNTGEQLERDMLLSDHIDGEMMAGTKHSGSFLFILENSSAEDIETIRIKMSAPINDDWDELGEDIDLEIEL
ncbi:hypothetical protein HXA31_05015 [Salipaludibacillus agaradhaerens]|uniref:DUF4352 domain-containing protein n=1 Tax=Salipaludibacillus agaradhaerens TaxID=76935 RepID=A0A9Q4B1Q9_SALAG|nr:hypothetical protein [Salipaludibacillus agaradhaerens]MCR6096727.1 hypothetical protein [Salipaludibacillus agaradhaerens]MCR6113714.1 hypothetical protein [Salipaludibacillus agaradhaerens]